MVTIAIVGKKAEEMRFNTIVIHKSVVNNSQGTGSNCPVLTI
jgi:hypothetical protein